MTMTCADSDIVGNLIVSNERVRPSVPVRHVAERFFSEGNLDALAVVEEGEPLGLVTRSKLLFSLFRRYGFELYGRKTISALADRAPLVVYDDERLDVAMDKALSRAPQDVYDEIVVIDSGGNYRGLLSVKQMIIQQSNSLANSMVQKELANERARELEKLGEIKSQFIAHVTHELRSPVNAIIGMVELMKIACEKGHTEQLRDRLSLMMTSAANLRAIITNILDLSKIEAGRMEVITEPFDLVRLLHEVAETTRILLGNKPVEVKVVNEEGSKLVVTDPVKLRQILINLTSNAAKFTETGAISISLREADKGMAISVSDTGIGIRPDDLERLFTAFSQLENAHTKRHLGTGLGLTISRSLTELLGGTLSVSSSYGRGSTFTLELPLHRQ